VTRQSAFTAGGLRFLSCPLVSGTFFVRGAATLAGNLALLVTIHRRKPAIFNSHEISAIVQCNLTSSSGRRKTYEKSPSTSIDRNALSGFAM
jgi:hypothetical protein